MKSRIGRKLAGAALLLWGGVAPSWVMAAPGAAEVLQFHPRQQGIEITTPRPNETAACKVELVKGQGKASGWLLSDPNGQPLRRFFDSNGDVKIDIWSYYKDGVETYQRMLEYLQENKLELNGLPMTAGLPLQFDPKAERFVDHAKANGMLTREYRKGFEVPKAF